MLYVYVGVVGDAKEQRNEDRMLEVTPHQKPCRNKEEMKI
jgi:hypothetical protein